MSSYVNFYVKDNKREVAIYLEGYSRSSRIYNLFSNEIGSNRDENDNALPLSLSKIRDMSDMAEALYESDKAHLKRIKDACEMFLNSNSPVSEKYDYIGSYQEQQMDIEEDMKELESAIWFLRFLSNIQCSDANQVIYAGIDAGNPDGSDDDNY